MENLPDFETAVTYTACLIPVAITTYRMLQSPTMRTILMDLAKVLAVTSMLGLVGAVPAPSPEPQVRGALTHRCFCSLRDGRLTDLYSACSS